MRVASIRPDLTGRGIRFTGHEPVTENPSGTPVTDLREIGSYAEINYSIPEASKPSATQAATSFLKKLTHHKFPSLRNLKTVPLNRDLYHPDEKPAYAFDKELDIDGARFRLRIYYKRHTLLDGEIVKLDKIWLLESEETVSKWPFYMPWNKREVPTVSIKLVRQEYAQTADLPWRNHTDGKDEFLTILKSYYLSESAYMNYQLLYTNNAPGTRACEELTGKIKIAALPFFLFFEDRKFMGNQKTKPQ